MNLEKFYLDVVGADGSGCIGYATQLGAGLPIKPAALLMWGAESAAAAVQRRTLRGALPRREVDVWNWDCAALAVAGKWQSCARPVRETLWESADGGVYWDNLSPRAKVTLRFGEHQIVGWGYLERLRLTVPPWQLPIHGLRWGRFVTAETSIVWIRWEHDEARSWLWVDGQRCEPRRISEQGVEWAGGRLAFHTHRQLRHGRLGETVFARWPQVERFLPARVRAYEETKWCSRATLALGERADVTGWAIHEFVCLR
ncbi:MAG: hypothetical protein NDI75_13305 [Candidatus Didemnitutus sp.]|nr:hypothetical protein [Candidatus Didemnitutus sp.]